MDSVDGMDSLVCLLSGIHGLKSTVGTAANKAPGDPGLKARGNLGLLAGTPALAAGILLSCPLPL